MHESKVVQEAELSQLVESLKASGKKVGLSHGVFDLVHPGHIQHFLAAKQMVDILIVSVTSDRFVNKGPGRPVFPQDIRLASLAALEAITYVTLSDNPTSENLIKIIEPNFYFKGSDYKEVKDDPTGKITNERQAVESAGGVVFFTDEITSSSSNLLNKFFSNFPESTQAWLQNFKDNYSYAEIESYLDKLTDLEIVLSGEVIIDQYTVVSALAKSSKDPILAFQRGVTDTFAGGVLAIANNCASWVKKVKVLSFIGNEDIHTYELVKLLNPNIDLDLITLSDRPTVLKHRFVDAASRVRIFEYYDFVDEPIDEAHTPELINHFSTVKPGQLVMIADYGHGMMNSKIIDSLCSMNNFLAVNTQANAGNRGYNTISKYNRADFFTLNSSEMQLELRNKNIVFQDVVPAKMNELSSQMAVITLGGDGLMVFDKSSHFKSPALATKVVDKVGAGDSVFAIGALLAYVGAPGPIIGLVCNIVAAHEVTQLGHRTSLQIGDIKKQIKSLLG